MPVASSVTSSSVARRLAPAVGGLLVALLLATGLVPASPAAEAAVAGPRVAVADPVVAPVVVGSLASGASVTAGTSRLVMQPDGNLVRYDAGVARWHTRTHGHPGARLLVQRDGNLVVAGVDGRPLWHSSTWGLGGRELQLAPGELSLRSGTGRVVWRNGVTLSATLAAGAELAAGESLVTTDRSHRLSMQGDGNLVLYRGATALWWSATGGSGATRAVLQADGDLALLAGGTAVWHTGTTGTASARLVLQGDGNTVLYGGSRAVWDSRGFTRTGAQHLVPGAVPGWALLLPASTRQVVRSVPSQRWCTQTWCAVTELWSKRSNGTWRNEVSYRSQSGPNGFSPMPRRAGDGTTPSGVFTVATTFSVYSTPPGRMPWKRRYPTSTVSGSQPYYNTWIEEPGRTDGTRPATEYGLWVNFNNARLVPFQGPEPDPRIGSGIFIHTLPATAKYIASEGCIAIGERTQMLAVLRWLDPAADPRIVFNR